MSEDETYERGLPVELVEMMKVGSCPARRTRDCRDEYAGGVSRHHAVGNRYAPFDKERRIKAYAKRARRELPLQEN